MDKLIGAYKADGQVNWCPDCATVLANEQVTNNHCERCGTKIEEKNMNQWYFKITAYKDRLIKNLDTINYPKSTIKQQKLWLENLRDWCVSRQRSWGCPIPIDGETDTLDTFVDSSFYYLRYLTDSDTEFLPKNSYRPVDIYIGGSEHACMHLIYARFIHMFLFDIGIVPQEEPFNQVIHQGMITANGAKMSKSKGNAISPDNYDPDELRMYLMFLGPYQEGGDWSDQHIVGVSKFLKRMKVWLNNNGSDKIDLNGFVTEINTAVINFKFNKVVSGFMTFYNKHKHLKLNLETKTQIVNILINFAPGFTIE